MKPSLGSRMNTLRIMASPERARKTPLRTAQNSWNAWPRALLHIEAVEVMSDQATTNKQERHVEDGAATYRRMSWRNSYWLVILIAVSTGVLTIAANVAMDWVIKGILRGMLPSDILDAAAAAALSGFVLIRNAVPPPRAASADADHRRRQPSCSECVDSHHAVILTSRGSGVKRQGKRCLRQNRLGAARCSFADQQ